MTERLKDIVNDAIELAPEAREAFLERLCAGDAALLEEARAMLAAHEKLGDFLEPDGTHRGLWARALEQAAPRSPGLVGAVLDRRYQLEERLGTGASGAVYEATDRFTGDRVAVKILTAVRAGDLGWARRELAALRLLELPGVVRLLDDGVHDGMPFLVMPKLEGSRFPGKRTPVAWADLAQTAIALLETVARIHARGVVHGDLKPANILVDEAGRPVVLDLGVSTGPSVPGARDELAGTPAYLSPEQLMGGEATPASDLYAVGVMLHEALTGTSPHPTRRFDDLVAARVRADAPRLQEHGVDPSACPVDVLDALLAREPGDRPRSAAHVAAILRGEQPPLEALRTHPVLQLDRTVEELVDAALRSPSVTLHGPPRSGRSNCLRRAAAGLRRAGKTVAWYDPQHPDASSGADVVIADDPDAGVPPGVDGVIRLVREPDTDSVRLRPLSEGALRALFGGSDRILHLREDAARELHRRTGGWPARIIDELSAWLRVGLARMENRTVMVDRSALDLLGNGYRVCPVPDRATPDPVLGVLAAGGDLSGEEVAAAVERPAAAVAATLERLEREGRVDRGGDGVFRTTTDFGAIPGREEHAAVARAMAPGTRGRLRHLVAARQTRNIAAEARAEALALLREAQVGAARATVTVALAAVRSHDQPEEDERLLLSTLMRVAAAEMMERSFELTLYEIGRARFESPEIEQLERLARVALLTLRGDSERALALADALGPLPEFELEQFRQGARAMAGRVARGERTSEVLASVEAWAAENDAREVRRKLLEWKGWAHCMQSRFDEAVAEQERALALAPDACARLASLVNVAEVALEAGLFDRAVELAEEAKATAKRLRHPLQEARAEVVLRGAAYRSGHATAVDMELVDAIPAVRFANLEAQLCLNEGCVAWRLHEIPTAVRLVRRAQRLWSATGSPWGAMLAHALLVSLGEPGDSGRLLRQAGECPLPGVAVQALALLGRRHRELARPKEARRIAGQLPEPYWSHRREVASVKECLEWLDRAREE